VGVVNGVPNVGTHTVACRLNVDGRLPEKAAIRRTTKLRARSLLIKP
jgi:hypothetical protein